VWLQTEIRIDEAALGGTIRVPTLFEGEVDLKVKPGTQAGHRMRLRGKVRVFITRTHTPSRVAHP